MKKALRISIPILLVIAIILCSAWYLFVYDRPFTRDVLLSLARSSEKRGSHSMAAWFYNKAYTQSGNSDAVAIELAEQYKSIGNYTKAEFTLTNAISDGGGTDLYIALCKTFVEQDKLLDALKLLDNVKDPAIKKELDKLRPKAPTPSPEPSFYSEYIPVTLSGNDATVYASAVNQYPSVGTDMYKEPFVLTDGLNTIYALSVAQNGLVSPLQTFEYTVGGVVKEMVFEDPAIEKAVRQLLSIEEDVQLYTNDLWNIRSFQVPKDAKTLSDLQYMSYLESLTIEDCANVDFDFLTSIIGLTRLSIKDTTISQDALTQIAATSSLVDLTLDNCNLSGIKPLEKMTGLLALDLSNNALRSLEALTELKSLQKLNLSHNAVANLSMISNLTTLTSLDVSHNALTTLSPIASLTSLRELNAAYNSISDLGAFENLTRLTNLSLEMNQLADIAPIGNCKELTELNIASNAITDISMLSDLVLLTFFDFSSNQVKALPAFPKDCELVTITGSHNLITSLDNLGGLQNLNTINMDYNAKISSVTALAECPLLIEVNIYGTKVKDVSMLTEQTIIVNYNPV